MKRSLLLAAGVISLTLGFAAAQSLLPDPDGGLDQGQVNERAIKEYERTDAELTKVFEQALAAEPTPQLREARIGAQRAWKSFVEAEGRYQSVESDGGTARVQYVNERMTFLTKQRLHQLRKSFVEGWGEPVAK